MQVGAILLSCLYMQAHTLRLPDLPDALETRQLREGGGPLTTSAFLIGKLTRAVAMFQKYGVPATVFYGSSLHLYRNDTSFYDDDVDFLVPSQHWHMVKPMLQDSNMEIFYETSYFVRAEDHDLSGGGLDIYKRIEDAHYICERQTWLGYPRSMVDPPLKWNLLMNSSNVSVDLPGQIIDFLVSSYGSDWRVPQAGKKPTNSEARDNWNKHCTQYHGHAEPNRACGHPVSRPNTWCPAKHPRR